MDLSQLKLNPNNPRIIKKEEFERLKNKIKEFPQMLEKRPIVYDEKNIILGGNQRFRVLQELNKEGFEIKDNYFANAKDWTDEQKRKFIIIDNIADGQWDYNLLANEWSELPLEEWGMNITGWLNGGNPDENKMWEGMPEFSGIELRGYKSIIVHFDTEEDYKKFFELIGQSYTDKTKYIWFPFKEKENNLINKVVHEP